MQDSNHQGICIIMCCNSRIFNQISSMHFTMFMKPVFVAGGFPCSAVAAKIETI